MFHLCRACGLVAAAMADRRGPWPYGPVDVWRLHAKPSLKELFDWHAVDGRLDGSGFTRLLQVQRESDGFKNYISDAFSRVLQAKIFNLSTNATLEWEDFLFPYQYSFFPHRRKWFAQFTLWSCLKVRRQTLPQGSLHYRYLPKTEARFMAAVGRSMVEWCNHHVSHRAKMPQALSPPPPPPPPRGGYQEESKALSVTAMLPQGCKIWGAKQATVRCSFPRKNAGQRGRLAVLVTGIKDRYYPRSAFKHVVVPAAREGYEVDYFALLDWQPSVATNRITGEAIGAFNPMHADNKRENRSVSSPQFANASVRQGLSLVTRLARASGASFLYLQFGGVQEDPPLHGCNRYLGRGSAEVMDYRRTRFAYKTVEFLWNLTLERSKREGVTAYTHVLWQREDAHWVDDLRLELFRNPWAVSGISVYGVCNAVPNFPTESYISDKVFLVGGVAAMSFFKLYDLVNCGNPSHELSQVERPEQFIVKATQALGLEFHELPWNSLPVIIGRHMKIYGYADIAVVFCLKFSRSCLFRPSGSRVAASIVPYRGCEEVSRGLHDRPKAKLSAPWFHPKNATLCWAALMMGSGSFLKQAAVPSLRSLVGVVGIVDLMG